MDDYFDQLKKTLEKNNLMKNPSQIYNVDETGMPLDHHPPKVVAVKGQKKVRSRTSGNKSQVTVIACVSATGHVLPPFVIFDAKQLNMEWTKGEVTGTRYGLSSTGWVDTELFKDWLVTHFLTNAVGGRPLMLVLDGHSTHYQPELIKYARQHDVILFCLPPHTTHESQPLDASVFKPLKLHWHEACHAFVEKNPGKSITKYNFSKLLNTAWGKTMSPSIISSGFKRTGIYPFNPHAIDYGVAPDEKDKQAAKVVPDKDKQATEVPDREQQATEVVSDKSTDNGEQTTVSSSEQRELSFYSNEEEPPAYPSDQQFTPEQEALFNRRLEENYDIPDPVYLEWLKINHPEKHPDNSSLSDYFSFAGSSDDLLLQGMDSAHPLVEDVNIVPHSVTPLTEKETPILEDEPTNMNSDPASATESCSEPESHVSECVEKLNTEKVSSKDDACPGPSHVPSTTMSAVKNLPPPEHEGELNYLSKYLVQYVPVKKPPPSGQRAAGARVLTSEECAQLIFEQEEKKKKQQQEKEARKAERELKKKEREEAAKKKAEQAAKRKEEAARKKEEAARKKEEAAKKKEEIAKKKEEAARKKLEKATGSTTRQISRRQKDTYSSAAKRRRINSDEHTEDEPLDDEMQETLSVDQPNMETEGSSANIDSNVCCVCFRTYEEDQEEETGFSWVKCVCQRWVHEDCYSEVVMDKHGRELICPYCVV